MKALPIDMKKQAIIMSAADHEALCGIIAVAGRLSKRGLEEIAGLERELTRAQVVPPGEVPSDVITMNTRAELLDLETAERMEFTLVYPADANIEESRISVLAPLGAAMIGYRVGDEFRWSVPYGERRLRVTAVRFQPEAEFNRLTQRGSAASSPSLRTRSGDTHPVRASNPVRASATALAPTT
jgi:regulator of nucleoside diphosphate kinase